MPDMPLKELIASLSGLEMLFARAAEETTDEATRFLNQQAETAIAQAVSLIRKVDAGELEEVVHAHCTGIGYNLHCSNCGDIYNIGEDYCPTCGARMDGKDGSNG